MSEFTHQDAALVARDAASKAELCFLCVVRTAADETDSPESLEALEAEALWLRANARFADTVPSTFAGAIAKLVAVEGLLSDIPLPDDSLEIRHLRTVVRYLEEQPAIGRATRRNACCDVERPTTATMSGAMSEE